MDWDRNQRMKLTDWISFPEQLDLAPFVAAKNAVTTSSEHGLSDTLYDLYAILIHTGAATGGHYVAAVEVCLCRRRRWQF